MDSQEILTFVVWNAKFMNYLTLLWPKETTNADRPAMWQPYYAATTQTKHSLIEQVKWANEANTTINLWNWF